MQTTNNDGHEGSPLALTVKSACTALSISTTLAF